METWSVRFLLGALALICIGAWANGISTVPNPREYPHHWLGIVAIVLLVLGYVWPKLASERIKAQAVTLASDVRVWFGIVVFVSLSGTIWTMILTHQRNQLGRVVAGSIEPMLAAIQRYSLPRQLDAKQEWAIALALRKHPSVPVTVRAQRLDKEAYDFARAVADGVSAGGWPTSEIEWVDELQAGLGLRCRETKVSDDARKINSTKQPVEILASALKGAGVVIDSGLGNSIGGDIERDDCTIDVGPRRRDVDAFPVRLRRVPAVG